MPTSEFTARSGPRLLGLTAVAGAALLALGATFHPMLSADPARQLHIIAVTPAWRAIHVVMLVGSVLLMAGLWSRVVVARPGDRPRYTVIVLVIVIGLAANAINVGFMARYGTADASRYVAGDASVIGPYVASHHRSLMFARAGNLLVAVGCLALGLAEWHDRARPRWIAWMAWIAGVGGLLGVLLFDADSRGAVAAVTLLSAWAVSSVALFWWRRGVPTRDRDSPG